MTNELNMETFGRFLGYPVVDYDSFVRTHRDFVLLVSQEQLTWTWLLKSLVQESVTKHDVEVSPLWRTGAANNEQLYRVHFTQPGAGEVLAP